MRTHTDSGRRGVLAGALAGACAIGVLGFAAAPADAAYKAQVQSGHARRRRQRDGLTPP